MEGSLAEKPMTEMLLIEQSLTGMPVIQKPVIQKPLIESPVISGSLVRESLEQRLVRKRGRTHNQQLDPLLDLSGQWKAAHLLVYLLPRKSPSVSNAFQVGMPVSGLCSMARLPTSRPSNIPDRNALRSL